MREILLEARDGDRTDEIQRSMDDVAQSGGRVVLGPGRFETGPLYQPSGVELHLSSGAVLVFDPDPDRYPAVDTRWEGVECSAYRPLLFSDGEVNVALTGDGVLDGNGNHWWRILRDLRTGTITPDEVPGVSAILERNRGLDAASGGGGRETGFLRPPLLQFKECTGVSIEGVTLRNSPFWTCHLLYCRDVALRRTRFEAPGDAPNTDGLDVDSCSHVTVEDCVFDVGDDCLCLKSGSDADGRRVGRPTEHVVISGCRMERGHGGVVFGSEYAGGIRDVRVSSCTMTGTDRGIRMKSRRGRGGAIENVVIEDLKIDDTISPLVMNLYYRCGITEAARTRAANTSILPVSDDTPSISGVTVRGLRATGVRAAAAVLVGLPESPLRDIALEDWTVELAAGADPEEPAMDFDGGLMAGAGVRARHVAGLIMDGVRIGRSEAPAG